MVKRVNEGSDTLWQCEQVSQLFYKFSGFLVKHSTQCSFKHWGHSQADTPSRGIQPHLKHLIISKFKLEVSSNIDLVFYTEDFRVKPEGCKSTTNLPRANFVVKVGLSGNTLNAITLNIINILSKLTLKHGFTVWIPLWLKLADTIVRTDFWKKFHS